jgi:hypothetical protein
MIRTVSEFSGMKFDGASRRFEVWMPIRTTTGLNQREHWAVRSKRVKRERQATRWFWKTHDMHPLEGYKGPMTIRLTRVSPSTRQPDLDNVVGGCKGIRDELAALMGRDDGDRTITWEYSSEKGEWGVSVIIEVPK